MEVAEHIAALAIIGEQEGVMDKSDTPNLNALTHSLPEIGSQEHKDLRDQGRKLNHATKAHYMANRTKLARSLQKMGLRIVPCESDGNCFFRAMCEQLEGSDENHAQIRAAVVEFMRSHDQHFAPFVEDDQTLEQHCKRMALNAAWAGNIEMQAASMLYGVNICVHQLGRFIPWEIVNVAKSEGFIHLAYEGRSHYNSVRKEYDCSQPSQPVTPFFWEHAKQDMRQLNSRDINALRSFLPSILQKRPKSGPAAVPSPEQPLIVITDRKSFSAFKRYRGGGNPNSEHECQSDGEERSTRGAFLSSFQSCSVDQDPVQPVRRRVLSSVGGSEESLWRMSPASSLEGTSMLRVRKHQSDREFPTRPVELTKLQERGQQERRTQRTLFPALLTTKQLRSHDLGTNPNQVTLHEDPTEFAWSAPELPSSPDQSRRSRSRGRRIFESLWKSTPATEVDTTSFDSGIVNTNNECNLQPLCPTSVCTNVRFSMPKIVIPANPSLEPTPSTCSPATPTSSNAFRTKLDDITRVSFSLLPPLPWLNPSKSNSYPVVGY